MASVTPRAAYQSMLAAAAERPAPQRACRRPARASQNSQKLSPPIPFMWGYTTAMVAAAAMAASRALPPARADHPDREASGGGGHEAARARLGPTVNNQPR
jgi:hypothetical protein